MVTYFNRFVEGKRDLYRKDCNWTTAWELPTPLTGQVGSDACGRPCPGIFWFGRVGAVSRSGKGSVIAADLLPPGPSVSIIRAHYCRGL